MVSVSSLPKGVWAQPTMQAVMAAILVRGAERKEGRVVTQ